MLLTTGYHSLGASNESQKGLKSPSEQKFLVSSLQDQRLFSKKEPYEKACLTSFVMRMSLDVERGVSCILGGSCKSNNLLSKQSDSIY